MADVELASTFKSEKSFEVSSASLRNSEVSRVARPQKSSPTTTKKKMTLGRILESDNTAELYSKRMLNSTAMQKRKRSASKNERFSLPRLWPPRCWQIFRSSVLLGGEQGGPECAFVVGGESCFLCRRRRD
jgi:hypothetical protein